MLLLQSDIFPYNCRLGGTPISIDIIDLSVEPSKIEAQLEQIYTRYFIADFLF